MQFTKTYDIYAAKAMEVLLSRATPPMTPKDIAKDAHRVAEAMMEEKDKREAERNRKEPPQCSICKEHYYPPNTKCGCP